MPGATRAVGLMSGTSMDGVDAALVRLADGAPPRLEAFLAEPYPETLADRLRAVDAGTPLAEVLALDAELAAVFAGAVGALLASAGCKAAEVDVIGCHGQTVWHAPNATPPVTCQLGDPSRLAEATGCTVVADFRQRDMAAGGEAAPLAPLFHAALFGGDAPRAVLNLGGIGNLTVLGAGARVRQGFDCGPANTLLDAWARRHLGRPMDEDGHWAAAGRVDEALLARLLADPYFQRPPPRSTGPEHFNLGWLEHHLAGGEAPADVQATLAELTARSVADAVNQWAPEAGEVLVCGGGANNGELMRRLAAALPGCRVASTASAGVPPEAVEAVGFAWLAGETLAGRAVDLRRVTGSRHPVRLGGIYPA
ncbi:anhydro-N-acetylmuramic acid kinase [Sediminicurvatus halobius]|uniref:Anhydro-N-acetylmuramic acid kinase n=1 Tax=Sediminicurvatus halobius TaxID=2182432 RepID=A0A2U2N0Z2_9GAMM|nr:anhydro-N-acetylmuramic acid kinase [Spiribacter halobius]PWG62738.1 anhydro-N-acetylmuramic acid kinase [Spiribacter halobius]UEX77407.1 anhydro-N-acetylmuramic acid kinase [Spiribacter halobius]